MRKKLIQLEAVLYLWNASYEYLHKSRDVNDVNNQISLGMEPVREL